MTFAMINIKAQMYNHTIKIINDAREPYRTSNLIDMVISCEKSILVATSITEAASAPGKRDKLVVFFGAQIK